MKVRLKHAADIFQSWNPMFQFHEGPIKTDLSQRRIFSSKWFQFHEGPIKTRNGR